MGCLLFGICNPVTGYRHLLPPLEWSVAAHRYVRCVAIVTATDTDLNGTPPSGRFFTFSQLLVTTLVTEYHNTTRTHRDHYYLHSYSATTCSSSTPTRFLDADLFSLVGDRSVAVLHRGAAHWLCVDDHDRRGRGPRGFAARWEHRLYKLSVEVATGEVTLTKLPVRGGGKPLLCVTRDSKLAVASVYPAHVTAWTQPAGAEDGGAAAAWPRTCSFRIRPKWQPKEEWCNFGRGSMLVLYRSGGAFVLDLDNDKEVMEKLMDCFPSPSWVGGEDERIRVAYITYEMDLVEFFTYQLQLGGLLRDGLGPEY